MPIKKCLWLLEVIHPTVDYISPAEIVPIAEITDIVNEMMIWA
jgi:hypothetical protein